MTFNGLLNLFLLDSNVPLNNRRAAVLQKLLDQSDVVVAVLVDLRGIVFSEAVSADASDTQVITDELELLLDCPLSQWEYFNEYVKAESCLLIFGKIYAFTPDEP